MRRRRDFHVPFPVLNYSTSFWENLAHVGGNHGDGYLKKREWMIRLHGIVSNYGNVPHPFHGMKISHGLYTPRSLPAALPFPARLSTHQGRVRCCTSGSARPAPRRPSRRWRGAGCRRSGIASSGLRCTFCYKFPSYSTGPSCHEL